MHPQGTIKGTTAGASIVWTGHRKQAWTTTAWGAVRPLRLALRGHGSPVPYHPPGRDLQRRRPAYDFLPRITPATDTPFSFNPKYAVSDSDFKSLWQSCGFPFPIPASSAPPESRPCAAGGHPVRRLANRRGNPHRRRLLRPVGQSERAARQEQFTINDARSLDGVVSEICDMGCIPSFCTACYRAGRTGEHFMKVAKSKFVHNFCIPNAIFTLKEYLLDYALLKPGQRASKC